MRLSYETLALLNSLGDTSAAETMYKYISWRTFSNVPVIYWTKSPFSPGKKQTMLYAIWSPRHGGMMFP